MKTEDGKPVVAELENSAKREAEAVIEEIAHAEVCSECGTVRLEEGQARALVNHKLMGGAVKKSELFNWVLDATGATKTASKQDDMIIRSMVGTIVADMNREGLVTLKGVKVVPTPKLGRNGRLTRGKTEFLRKIHNLGGAFFEEYAVRLLEKYYTMIGCNVVSAIRTGGSNDGGVDGALQVEDHFGFVDVICLQCKNRTSDNTVTTKEVREFYGAMTAIKATRGIYVTTAHFHDEADKFLRSLHNCVGIDGDGIYRLALKTQYGITGSGENARIDYSVIKPL